MARSRLDPTSAPRAVLVTGAGRGLGAAFATRLAHEGYAVALADVDLDAVTAHAAVLPDARAVRLDVRSEQDWGAAAQVLEELGEPWGLVGCAARTVVRDLFEITPQEWDDVLAVNLRGAFLGIRAVAPLLRAHGGGRIVTVSSDSAFKGRGVTGAHYATSKAGLLTLTRRAAAALAADGVTVNALVPGTIDGATVRELSDPLAEAAAVPTGRLVDPDRLAGLLLWLLSEEAGDVTGAELRVDGGASL
ncbi:MAG: SDR family NAD(P)-dependent oxidoreductase [Gaiella sp.]